MKKTSLLIMFVAIATMVFVSCKKDISSDSRDEITGTYSGTISGQVSFSETGMLDSTLNNNNCTIEVTKDGSSGIIITKTNIPVLKINASYIPITSMILISDQSITDGNASIVLSKTVNVSSGLYIASSKNLSFIIIGKYNYTQGGTLKSVNYYSSYNLTKK
jgi:hypothetical protein